MPDYMQREHSHVISVCHRNHHLYAPVTRHVTTTPSWTSHVYEGHSHIHSIATASVPDISNVQYQFQRQASISLPTPPQPAQSVINNNKPIERGPLVPRPRDGCRCWPGS